ncbi:MAG: cytidylate kinase, partial [Candidatus Cloacimonadaceae bacterium]|nr:cytidylate kinase [Candidatus Cloacimonadaceae bacterium]
SSNTRMLHHLCGEICPSIQIETEAELNPDILKGFDRIGISAGASTPAQTIVNVFNIIKKINGEAADALRIEDIPLFKEESC